MAKTGLALAVAGAVALGGGAAWIGGLRVEQDALVRHLSQTEELLRNEREAAERAEVRHALDLRLLRGRQDDERRLLIEQHDASVRNVTAEALRVQIELMRLGYKIVAPQRRPRPNCLSSRPPE